MSLPSLPLLFRLGLSGMFASVWSFASLPSTATAPAARSIELGQGTAVEVLPSPPPGALEEGMSGELARLYAAGINAVRAGQYRRALTGIRQARVVSYRELQTGPVEHRLAQRHFERVLYLEEQLSELTLIDEQLERPVDHTDQRKLLLQVRALILQNLFLAVRSFLGVSDTRLLNEGVKAYQVALDEADNLKQSLLVGYAAMLAERGSRREARQMFAKLSEQEREQDGMDIAIAYYYLALGDRSRAIARLLTASQRDSWLHGSPGHEGHSFRSQVYRMNNFDRLREHPRFAELITDEEER